MGKISIKASLVGMRYHGISQGAAVIAPNDRAKLRREPNNTHDRNAIAVEVGSRTVGHIDRDKAAILAPMLDQGATYEAVLDLSRPRSAGAIPLIVRIENRSERIPQPTIARGGTPGIYRLFIVGHEHSYFGQARDIQDRICQHWDSLNKGVHANPVLRQLWRNLGGEAFRAEVVEKAPSNLTDLALARWLVERERHWISHHGGLRGTLNRVEPELVLNDAAKQELVLEQKERERQRKEQAKIDRARYEEIKSLRPELNRKIVALRDERLSIEKMINSATGVRGFLFASDDEKRNVPTLKAKADNIAHALEPLEKQSIELDAEISALKRKLYPARRKRAQRGFY